ncbi:MAG: hypothetical protein IPJ81_00300 [Chitinophagaceae bacterium]|nr:hypothetical protein [Chitinophagaceae bacterium]
MQAAIIINSNSPSPISILKDSYDNAIIKNNPSPCAPQMKSADFYIDKCSFNNIESISGDDNGYGYYPAIKFDVNKESAFTFNVSVKDAGNQSLYYTIYIDKNNDGLYAGPEKVYMKQKGPIKNIFADNEIVYLPADLKVGEKGLRICVSKNPIDELCNEPFEGEMEDYTINVLANPTAGCIVKPKNEVSYMDKISFDQLVINTGDNLGYKDFTNQTPIELSQNTNYTIKVYPKSKQPATINKHAFSIWVDIDNHNIFEYAKGEL